MDPGNAPHVSLVVSPLRTLMSDQLRRCREMGVGGVVIGRKDEMTSADRQGAVK